MSQEQWAVGIVGKILLLHDFLIILRINIHRSLSLISIVWSTTLYQHWL